MEKYKEDKNLIKINENNIFYKIKKFFKKLFNLSDKKQITNYQEENVKEAVSTQADKKNLFVEELKKVDDEETLLLKLQKKYRNGEIKEEELSKEQISSLCELYDKQISEKRKSNRIRRKRILELKKASN